MNRLAKEFLFFLAAALVGLLIGFLFLYLVNLQPAGIELTEDEQVFSIELYIVGVILGIAGTYLARAIVWALKKLILKL